MATSGTTAFNLDFTDIAEEAWERAGEEMRTGYQLRTARRSMNLMLIEWQNRGINMWTIDQGTISLVSGTAEYALPADTVDVLECVRRQGSGTNQSDIHFTRVSVDTYANIPNKNTQGTPINAYFKRERDNPSVVLWPVPNNNDYTFVYWRMRRVEDAGDGVENPDMPFRFLPALTAGLAYHIAMKVPTLAARIPMLKGVYDEQFAMAASEDRERATWRIVPSRRGLGR